MRPDLRAGAWLTAILSFAGCTPHKPVAPPPPTPHPHFTLGAPYQANGHWYYPSENYALEDTGIAAIGAAAPDTLTADGEAADPTALTAAMPTIQLPAIADVTNLENGRQIRVRINDRGPPDPARLIAVSPRAAQLLAMTGPTRVRVQLDAAASHAAADALPGAPRAVTGNAAPSAVTAQPLDGSAPATTIGMQSGGAETATVPLRLPERILQLPAAPGTLFIRAGSFGRFDYANRMAAGLYGLGGEVIRRREGRQEVYDVRAGPFPSIAAADAAMRQALAAGVIDAHITVE